MGNRKDQGVPAEGAARLRAEAEAEKRERHKPKSMVHKQWEAVHDPVKGWHAALVDNQWYLAQQATEKARRAFHSGDFGAFVDAAGEALLAKCRAASGTETRQGGDSETAPSRSDDGPVGDSRDAQHDHPDA